MNARQQTTAATYGSSLYGTWGFDDYGYPDWSKAQGGGTWLQDLQYTFNGVTGNLDYREDNRVMESEIFIYDNLDRLTEVMGIDDLSMDYDARGNITEKRDLTD